MGKSKKGQAQPSIISALEIRGDKIRTYDPSHPIRVRYQTALHPDKDWVLFKTASNT